MPTGLMPRDTGPRRSTDGGMLRGMAPRLDMRHTLREAKQRQMDNIRMQKEIQPNLMDYIHMQKD